MSTIITRNSATSGSIPSSLIQGELAIKRMEICDTCDSKKTNPVIHCGECGCLLSKKIYTPVIGGCPRGKWVAVEMDFESKKNKKIYDSIKK